MISIVTGTLNRKELLPGLIANTVGVDNRLELILVDGGSDDGTIEYIESLDHPHIKLVRVGERSSYPHFMNLGIKESKYDYVCQWNDDVLLVNDWSEVIDELDDNDFYIFNWKYGNIDSMVDHNWISGKDVPHSNGGWCLTDNTHLKGGELVMNYGIYNKKIFKEIGMYNNEYHYYYADGDMCYRSHAFGYRHKSLWDIKVCSLPTTKTALHGPDDVSIYEKNRRLYDDKILPQNIEYYKK
jgi:glycosyltransferase involved in cell wall biosynthesis